MLFTIIIFVHFILHDPVKPGKKNGFIMVGNTKIPGNATKDFLANNIIKSVVIQYFVAFDKLDFFAFGKLGVFIKLNHPKSVTFVRLNGKSIAENTNISILSFVVLYLFLFVLGTIIVVITGVDPVTASSSVATCMAGIGPGLGTVGPMSNFAHLPEVSKFVLSLLMILGRLEIITVFTIFTKAFWKL